MAHVIKNGAKMMAMVVVVLHTSCMSRMYSTAPSSSLAAAVVLIMPRATVFLAVVTSVKAATEAD